MNAWQTVLPDSVLHRLGWALVHFLWQGTAVAAVLAVTLRLLRSRGPQACYLAGCVALALLAALPVATALWVDPPAAPTPSPALAPAPLPPMATPPDAPVVTVSPVGLPDVHAVLTAAPIERVEPAVAAPPARPVAPAAAPPAPADPLAPFLPHLVAAWLTGVAALGLWRLAGCLGVRRLRTRGLTPAQPSLARLVAELAGRMGVRRLVRVARSARLATPVMVGFLRPLILLPAGALTGLTQTQLRAILAHELAHVRRGDYLVNLLQLLLEALLFYHPAVWWVSRAVRVEREHCCDDLAAKACGDRLDYARTLLAMEERRHGPRLALGAGGAPLAGRIRRLLGAEPAPDRRGRWLAGLLVLALLAAAGVLVPLACAPKEPADTLAAHVPAEASPTEPADIETPDTEVPDAAGRVWRAYDVADLLAVVPDLAAPAVGAEASTDRRGTPLAAPVTPEELAELLLQTCRDVVAPQDPAAFEMRGTLLRALQTAQGHERVAGLLRQLRQRLWVAIEAHVIEEGGWQALEAVQGVLAATAAPMDLGATPPGEPVLAAPRLESRRVALVSGEALLAEAARRGLRVHSRRVTLANGQAGFIDATGPARPLPDGRRYTPGTVIDVRPAVSVDRREVGLNLSLHHARLADGTAQREWAGAAALACFVPNAQPQALVLRVQGRPVDGPAARAGDPDDSSARVVRTPDGSGVLHLGTGEQTGDEGDVLVLLTATAVGSDGQPLPLAADERRLAVAPAEEPAGERFELPCRFPEDSPVFDPRGDGRLAAMEQLVGVVQRELSPRIGTFDRQVVRGSTGEAQWIRYWTPAVTLTLMPEGPSIVIVAPPDLRARVRDLLERGPFVRVYDARDAAFVMVATHLAADEDDATAQLLARARALVASATGPDADEYSVQAVQGQMVVSAPAAGHEAVRAMLEDLRSRGAPMFQVSVQFVQFDAMDLPAGGADPRAAAEALLARAAGERSWSADGPAVLLVDEETVAALLELARGDERASILSAPRLTTLSGQRAWVHIGEVVLAPLPPVGGHGSIQTVFVPVASSVTARATALPGGDAVRLVVETALTRDYQPEQRDGDAALPPGVAVARAASVGRVPAGQTYLMRIPLVRHRITGYASRADVPADRRLGALHDEAAPDALVPVIAPADATGPVQHTYVLVTPQRVPVEPAAW